MEIDVIGLVVLVLFYAVILVIGILATIWYKRHVLDGATETREVAMVAGRRLGGAVGVFTMTATTVGGGYINGTAESVATQGLVWTLAPLGICVGLIIGGVVFARRMREQQYLTMLDPFQQRYGDTTVGLLYCAALCGDLFWSSSILAALGTSLSVIIGVPVLLSVLVSAGVVFLYTMFGQLISVAYTDIIQLIFITVGLVLSMPFILLNPLVEDLSVTSDRWLGHIPTPQAGMWADLLIAMTLGTIPWQTYFQRVLAVKSARYAQMLSIGAGVGAALLGVPSILLGAVATSTDWNSTALGYDPIANGNGSLTLPLTLHYLCPRAVSLIGLGAVTAAVMSSIDSAVLSSASLFTHNIYKMLLRKQASERELMIIQRLALLFVGGISTLMALLVQSIYGMFIMAADIVYVVMFPQLTVVLFIQHSNAYGAILGFFVGVFLRLTAGERYLSLPPLIKYPFYSEETGQLFPFRSFAMLCSLATIVGISYLTRYMFLKTKLNRKADFLNVFSANTQDKHVKNLEDSNSRDQLLANGKDSKLYTSSTAPPMECSENNSTAVVPSGDEITNYSPTEEERL